MFMFKRGLSLVVATGTLAIGVAGCGGGEDVKGAVDDAGKSVEQAAPDARRKAEDAARDAGKSVEQAAPDARNKAEDAARNAREKLRKETGK